MSCYNNIIKYNELAHAKSLLKFKEAEILYITGNYSLTKLCKTYNFALNSFSAYLKNKGISVINKQNICKFNQHIFDNIDTEEKAYWLGFIYADGYVSYRDNGFEVSLQLRDIGHLEKLKVFLEWSGYVKTDHFRCRLDITNKHLKQILISKGCTPRKSLTLTFPNADILTTDLIPHFIRGYFDGDGSIYISKVRKSKSGISVLSTSPFLQTVQEVTCWKRNKLIYANPGQFTTMIMGYGGKQGLHVLNYLYKNATIYLDRKYEKYKEYCRLYE